MFNNMNNFKELYEFLQLYEEDNIIKWLEEPWIGKDKQESLLRLIAGLGLIDKLKSYDVCKGNFNKKTITKINSVKDIFYNKKDNFIKLKDKGDSSDLTCISKSNSKHLLLTTSKNLNKTQVGKLDIDKILTNFQKYKKDKYTMSLCICIRDNKKFQTMKEGIESSNKDLKSILEKKDTIIIDWNDLNHAYHQFKLYFKNKTLDSIINSNKNLLCLKMHQSLSVLQTIKMKSNKKKKILWGHIQRSGKSYIIGGCIIEDSKDKDICNYLVITTAPNETIEQQRKVFDCIQLDDFNIIILNGKNKKPVLTDKNIIICSKQFLQTKIDNKTKIIEKTKSIKWLKDMNFDMRFIDDSHNGGTTTLAKKTLDFYGNKTFTVQITATYSKPINDYNIPKDSWILWDLEDIKLCKNIKNKKSVKKLVKKHGDDISKVIEKYLLDNIISEYSKYPELWLLTDEIKTDVVTKIINNTRENSYGWSPDSCFLLKQCVKKDKIIYKKEFQNESENLKLWYRIFGKRDKFNVPDKEYPDNIVFMKRIEKICKNPEINSRFIGEGDFKNEPMIIMAFLPQNNIDKISKATKKLLKKHKVIPDYEIISINSKTTSDPKQSIEDARIKARIGGKKGVLVLSGKQCSLGVSINNCDIVLLLNNSTCFDMIYQMMFRCMTEGKNKKCGFVVDLNIHRVVETSIINYASLIKPSIHPKEATKYILQERLINLNGDHWMSSFGNNKSKINNLCKNVYELYSSNTEKALNHFLNRLCFKQVFLTKEEQIIFNAMFSNKTPTKEQKELIDKLIEDDNGEIKKGIEKIKIESDENLELLSETSDKNKKEDKKINYMDILKHIIPLICLLTIHNKETSFVEMFNVIENNKYVYDILIDQTKSWWGKSIDTRIIKKFINVYVKYMKDDKETNQIIRTVKELFMKNIKNNRELSNLIDKYLIPQELEKKINAEVSTPFKLRQEMLDKMPTKFWTKKRRVFEPCSGKGGFIIDIIDRFMLGLKKRIPDDKKRYKTIVEECLYFSDINPTNIFICRLLIDPYNEYKLNYNEGNTLELDIKEKWISDGFDAVIGNPPYNNELWAKFVDYSIENLYNNGYLLYVHPCNWRKPKHKIGNIMKKYDISYLKIYNIKNTSKLFNCNVRVDWYLLQKKSSNIETLIIDDTNTSYNINIKNKQFIPNNLINIIYKVSTKNIKKLNIIRSHKIISNNKKLKDKKTKSFKYPVLTNLNSKGKRIKYTDNPIKDVHNKHKVLMSYSLNLYPFYDNVLSPTEHVFYQIVNNKKEGEKLVKYLNTKLFSIIIQSSKWIGYQTDHKIFEYLPNIIDNINDINDENIYKYFKISKEEIKLIESSIY
jgi:hypothetical protein